MADQGSWEAELESIEERLTEWQRSLRAAAEALRRDAEPLRLSREATDAAERGAQWMDDVLEARIAHVMLAFDAADEVDRIAALVDEPIHGARRQRGGAEGAS